MSLSVVRPFIPRKAKPRHHTGSLQTRADEGTQGGCGADTGRAFENRHEARAIAELGDASGGRVPRITRLMALAIKLDHYVQSGFVKDYAELARVGHVSRARITQIVNLNLLAPDVQEALLDLPKTMRGRDPIRERHLRSIAAEPDWQRQRAMWARLQSL
ncbi:MAG: hypothetical protein MJA84_12885 [Firmicutes bacterium]|nr:hypothetical protein [Bacillota bacterium]